MNNSMDKCPGLVKAEAVLSSHNDIERLGQPWDTERNNLL